MFFNIDSSLVIYFVINSLLRILNKPHTFFAVCGVLSFLVRHDYKKRGFNTKKEAKEAEDAFLLKIKGGYGRIKMNALIKLYHEEMKSTVKGSTLVGYIPKNCSRSLACALFD